MLALPATLVLLESGVDDGSPKGSHRVERTAAWERYLEVGGKRIRTANTGRGPAIPLLHGWADSSFTWRDLIPRLSKRFRVVAHDCPGFGYSADRTRL